MMVALYRPGQMIKLEWRDKVEPPIRPDMDAKTIEMLWARADGNGAVERLTTLWGLLGASGRVQIHSSTGGRQIRMVGRRSIAKAWRKCPTLIADGTGDAELLRAIWPKLVCETDSWVQLPRPDNVRIIQVVDRAMSKLMVAIEGSGAKLAAQERAARRLWAAILAKAVEYGPASGANVGVVVYKSTEQWIKANCFVPPWVEFIHFGDVTARTRCSTYARCS
jgi:hypothetical protein